MRRLTACAICYNMEVTCATCGSATVTAGGVAVPEGVYQGYWAAANRWSGPGGASAVGVEIRAGVSGADRAGPGVVGARMTGPGGSGVDSQRSEKGTGI